MPALVLGVPVTPVFKTIILSSIRRVSALTVTVEPDTVKSPLITTFSAVDILLLFFYPR